jgi:dTDP-4-dehydrorhamnose 3,5-epimerase
MRYFPASIKDVLLIEPDVRKDERGFFLEFYNSREYETAGIRGPFVQDNHSRSVQGTLRGLHAQFRRPQAKLVRVIQGEIYDVAVDVRADSPTYGQWTAQKISSENSRQIYIPTGFLHGFCVLSPFAEVEYKCSAYYDPGDEIGVAWNDPTLQIRWPISDPILSEKDKALPTFASVKARFEENRSR